MYSRKSITFIHLAMCIVIKILPCFSFQGMELNEQRNLQRIIEEECEYSEDSESDATPEEAVPTWNPNQIPDVSLG